MNFRIRGVALLSLRSRRSGGEPGPRSHVASSSAVLASPHLACVAEGAGLGDAQAWSTPSRGAAGIAEGEGTWRPFRADREQSLLWAEFALQSDGGHFARPGNQRTKALL